MVRLLTVDHVAQLVQRIGVSNFIQKILEKLRHDFANWDDFTKSPRFVNYVEEGVVELMPICGKEYFAFKYVNGHPKNPLQNKLNVVATGMLIDVASGYPLLISEMTLLTAIRTAAISALAAQYLARKNSTSVGIIGTGSQAEFQIIAHQVALGIKYVKYFDIDAAAMEKFKKNLIGFDLNLEAGADAQSTVKDVDIVITATANRNRLKILQESWIQPGMHINGIGGDSAGKTELDPNILKRSKIVVEYLEQSRHEGEIQNLDSDQIYAELWQLIKGIKIGRESDDEVTLFDSVGFALEDYSALTCVYQLCEEQNIGQQLNMVPDINDPKDLFQFMLRN